MSLASSSSEPSPEPLFDMHDLHGQAALHVAARLGQAQVVKVLFYQIVGESVMKNNFFWSLIGTFGSWCECRSS